MTLDAGMPVQRGDELDRTHSATEPDFIGIEITRGRLQSIVDEAGAALIRTAFSHIVREAKDFACVITTPDGSTIVQSAQSVPVFLGTMTHAVRSLIGCFPVDALKPGDVIGTNDPWLSTGHLFDLTLVAPVFVGTEVVAFAAITAHLPDVGGRGFTVDSPTVFEEGVRLPPLYFTRSGETEQAIRQILAANVRLPEQVLGDVDAMLNGLTVIGRRLRALCGEMGVTGFRQAYSELEKRTEQAFRRAIHSVPDGIYEASVVTDGVVGKGFAIRLSLTVDGEEIRLDFTGSSPQVAAAVNSPLAYTRAYVVFALKCLLAPRLPFNEGILRAIRVDAPEGTVVSSRFPAACAARNLTGHFIPNLVIDALREVLPDRSIAECGSPRPIISLSGTNPRDGRMYYAPVLVMGGFGARAKRDGPSALVFPTNTETVPVEMVESTSPLLFDEKELVTDTGGPGRSRGGLGQRVTLRSTAGDLLVSFVAQHLDRGPKGVLGGLPGGGTRVFVDGKRLDSIPGPLTIAAGKPVTLESPGGGGFGPPAERDRNDVERDLRLGYISAECADRVYGVRHAHNEPARTTPECPRA
ncbi:MAG: hydantoinase B/oxoprolinase family protein [Betaproteobacteria bacterium]|nr:hydantoinase B/oxoprolinase family protein [Betaproteobacteria bacterium]